MYYLERDGATYTCLVRGAQWRVHRMQPYQCREEQDELLEVVAAVGMDGLESLWLAYTDCAASDWGVEISAERRDRARRLAEVVWFSEPPAANLHQPVTRYNSVLERRVQSAAVREVVVQYSLYPAELGGFANLDSLLLLSDTRAALCGQSLRPTPDGEIPTRELWRQLSCDAGLGPQDACELLQQSGFGGLAQNTSLDAAQLDALRSSCDQLASTPTGKSGPAFDPLDLFSDEACLSAEEPQVVGAGKVAELMADCFAPSEGGNPLATEVNTNANCSLGSGSACFIDLGVDNQGTPVVGFVLTSETDDPDAQPSIYIGYGETPEEAYQVAAESCAENGDVCVEMGFPEPATDTSTSTTSTSTTSTSGTESETPSSATPSTTSGLEPVGFDLSRESCKELAGMGLLNGHRDGGVWDELYERTPGRDPRTENPNPLDSGAGEPFCNDAGPTAAACNDLVMCAEGSVLQDDCSCAPLGGGQSIPLGACYAARCDDGSTPVPVGAFLCMCVQEAEHDSAGPVPDPDNPWADIMGRLQPLERLDGDGRPLE
jgi:hypothetical protein